MTKQSEKGKPPLHIVRYGTPCLRKPPAKVTKITSALKTLAKQMLETMRTSDGVGLAATQVEIDQQIAVIDTGEGAPKILLNPRIVKKEGEQEMVEGCLSLPGLYGLVKRANRVTVEATDLNGKKIKITGEGLLARALQHEIDHLHGKLFIDRVDESTLHWLIKGTAATKAEPISQPTTLQDALRVFLSRPEP